MNNTILSQTVFTPEQVAEILQLSKGTVYELIKKGEIVAKRLGNTYRIPRHSISFVFEGLDWDILQADTTAGNLPSVVAGSTLTLGEFNFGGKKVWKLASPAGPPN